LAEAVWLVFSVSQRGFLREIMFDRVSGIKDYWEVVRALRAGNLADARGYPRVTAACRLAEENNEFSMLDEFLRSDPWLLERAILNTRRYPFEDPRSDEVHKIQGLIRLGVVNGYGDVCGLDPKDFTQGLLITGLTGGGKTYPRLRIADQILSVPRSERDFNLIFIQVLKRDADFLIKKHPSLRVIEWGDLRYNPFHCESWDDPEVCFSYAIQVFCATNYLAIRTETIFEEAVRVCRKQGGVVNFFSLLDCLPDAVQNLGYQGFESRNFVDKAKDRLHKYKETGVVMNCGRGFGIEDFWAEEDVVLNLMDQPNDYVHGTLVADLLMKLLRFHEGSGPRRYGLKTLVGIDECWSVFPVLKDQYDMRPDRYLEAFVNTRRAAGIGLEVATQFVGDISPSISGNASFVLSLRSRGEHLGDVSSLVGLSEDQKGFFAELPRFGGGVMSDARFNRLFYLGVPSDLVVEEVSRAEVDALMRSFIDGLHAVTDVSEAPVVVVDDDDGGVRGVEDVRSELVDARVKAGAFHLLKCLVKSPFLGKTELRDLSGLKGLFGACADWLVSEGLVEVQKFFKTGTKKADFFVLTEFGLGVVGVGVSGRISPSHFGHSYYKWRVRAWLEGRGLKALEEFGLARDGRKIKGGGGRVDVFCPDIGGGVGVAFEVQLSLKRKEVIGNIVKCFGAFGADRVVIVCEKKDPGVLAARRIVEDAEGRELSSDLVSRVDFLAMTEIP
jgi:hypothetical protein